MSNENKEFSSFRDKPDMSMIWLKHMDRTNLSAANLEGTYDAYVRQQLRLLPTQWQKWVLDQEDQYSEEKYEFIYEYKWGRKRGYEHVPVLYDDLIPVKRLPDDEIDWEDKNIRSPKRKLVKHYDYEKFNLIILTAAENAGLSWKTEPTNSEYGMYPDIEEDLGTPNPLDDPKKNEQQEAGFLQKPKWLNFRGTPKLVSNFRGYAVGVGAGEKPWFFSEIMRRQKKQEPIVILVTATQGKGKTYTAIRLAEIFDKRFDPYKQIVMKRSQITKLISGRGNLNRNQAIIIDESQFGANARSWGNKDQQSLMNFLAAARFYGYMIFIVALHRSMLDSIIRERIINFHVHMEERGLGTIYQPKHARFDETNYPTRMGKLLLQLPDYDRCNYVTCLTCRDEIFCNTVRSQYEHIKKDFVQTEAQNREVMEQDAQEARSRYSTFEEVKQIISNNLFEPSRRKNGSVIKGLTISNIKKLGCKINGREESALLDYLYNTNG